MASSRHNRMRIKIFWLEAVVIPGDPRNMKVTFIEDIFKLEEMI